MLVAEAGGVPRDDDRQLELPADELRPRGHQVLASILREQALHDGRDGHKGDAAVLGDLGAELLVDLLDDGAMRGTLIGGCLL
eukprot:4273837-Prymnesium_polylepis.1